jgi:hypothetical protein
MPNLDRVQRLAEASAHARAAENGGDDASAAEEWRRYRLILGCGRDLVDLADLEAAHGELPDSRTEA